MTSVPFLPREVKALKKTLWTELVLATMLVCLPYEVHAGIPQTPKVSGAPNVAKAALPKSAENLTGDASGSLSALPVIDPKTYHIGVEDELMISVWREPELSTQVVVRPDGKITLPLLNDLDVVGMRTDQLQDVLTEKLKPFVNTPQVTIIVRGIRSRKVNLIGQVGRQGSFDLNDNKTMLDLIAQAGGLSAFAKGGSIYILREVGGKKIRIGFNYKKAIAGKGPNPLLEPGDLVVVP
jgi:polysaccharide export outer membrane protein